MKFVPPAASVKIARTALKARKHSPALMFGGGVVAAVASTVFACKATLQLEEKLNVADEEKREFKHKLERLNGLKAEGNKAALSYTEKNEAQDLLKLRVRTAVEIGKLYAPAIGLGLLSISLLTGSHIVLTKRNVALTAAYSVLEKGFNEYRSRVREELGDDKDREFLYGPEDHEYVEEGDEGHVVVQEKRIGGRKLSGYARVFDELNPNWKPGPEYNRLFLSAIQAHMNHQLNTRGHVFLNDVYDALKIERSKEGSVVGWLKDQGDACVDFGMFDEDNQIKRFMMGEEGAVWLDFNVIGNIWDKI